MNQRGGVAVIATGFLVTALIMGALVIDLGYLFVTRNQLQNIADSAALAAGRALGSIYRGGLVDSTNLPIKPLAMHAGTIGTGYALTAQDQATIQNAATEAANEHIAGGARITTAPVVIGHWNHATQTFTPGTDFRLAPPAPGALPNAVQVTVQRAPGQNGPVTAFFAGIIGISTLNVSSNTARAALLPLSFTPSNQPPPPPGPYMVTLNPNLPLGSLDLPIAVSQAWADNACGTINPNTRPHPLLFSQRRDVSFPANLVPPWPPLPPLGMAWDPDPADPAQGGQIGNSCMVIHTFSNATDVGEPVTMGATTIPQNWGGIVQQLAGGNFPVPALTVGDTLLLGPNAVDNNAADAVGIGQGAGKNGWLAFRTFLGGSDYFFSRFFNPEATPPSWNTIVPVYQDQGNCQPQVGSVTIVGFTAVNVNGSRQWLSIESLCPTVGTGTGRNAGQTPPQNFGTLASIPLLVCGEDDPTRCPQ